MFFLDKPWLRLRLNFFLKGTSLAVGGEEEEARFFWSLEKEIGKKFGRRLKKILGRRLKEILEEKLRVVFEVYKCLLFLKKPSNNFHGG
jgi:hypothetical protein